VGEEVLVVEVEGYVLRLIFDIIIQVLDEVEVLIIDLNFASDID
jgi:hypothetical protein